ncbi:MAG: AAA family ATPase [Hyphomonadaceae bacterium]|jgi:hypothetical protein|nr:AAA family ATPase [Hyphomonadaceae bacterium]
MLLHSLTVSGAGRFATPHRLAGLQRGLNVLSAPNETGKSTLFDALKLALFAPFKTADGKLLGRLPTRGANLPLLVDLEFEIDGMVWRLEKQFLSRQFSRLYQDGRQVEDGTSADTRVWELIGANRAERRHFDVLWLDQARGGDLLKLPDAALPTFNTAIDLALGSVVDTSQARNMLDSVAAELDKTGAIAKGGRKGSELARLNDSVGELEARLAGLCQRRDEADVWRTELASQRAALDQFARDGLAARLERAAEEAASALKDAQSRRAERLALDASVQRAQAARRRAMDDIETARSGLAALVDAAARLDGLQQASADAEAQLQVILAEAPPQDGEQVATRQALQDELAFATVRARHNELAAQLPGLEQAAHEHAAQDETLIRTQAALAALPDIGDDLLDHLDACERVHLQAAAAAQAGRARITVTRHGAGQVLVNGAPLDDAGLDQSLDQSLVVTVPGLLSITVEPPTAPGELEGDLSLAENRLRQALADAGVTSVLEARRVADDRRQHAREIKRLTDEIAARTARFGAETAVLRLSSAQATLTALERTLDQFRADWRDTLLLDVAALQSALEAQDQQIAASAARRAAHVERLQAARIASSLAAAEAAAGARLLDSLRASGDEVRLRERLGAAEMAAAEALEAVDAAMRAISEHEARHAGAASLIELELTAERTRQAVANHARDLRQRQERVTQLETSLGVSGLDGLDEQVTQLEGFLDADRRALAREQARLAALTMLRDRLQAAIDGEQARLTAPLTAAITPYLELVFPEARLTFDQGFAPDELVRSGAGQFTGGEGQMVLSHGTREQIGLLARFALADVLDASGRAWPVILDDALGFADDARLQAMFNALTLAARHRQVLVLTCHETAFASLGGTRVQIVPVGRDAATG